MAKKLFTNAKTEAALGAAVSSGTLDAHVAFIEESGKEGIYAKGKTYQTVPSNGTDGQVLMASSGKGVWVDLDIVDLLSYGVEWDSNVADPSLTRVGNMNYHKTLPIQSGMKGCIYNPKEKKVVYWLDEDNWYYKEGGNPNKGQDEDAARLDGYDGEVMVYVPEFYIKSWVNGTVCRVMISPTKIDETWEYQPALFVGAYRDTILNTVPEDMGYLSTLEVNTAVSIANTNTYCRGGNNDSTKDNDEDEFKRNLGKARTNITRNDFRTYARQAGKEILSYRQYKNILYWLWVIEYATFNSQANFNPELTSEGFRQGGMSDGITNVSDPGDYNNYCPICPNGYTNEFGNRTAIKEITPGGPDAVVDTVKAIRWRGIENNFGDVLTSLDGIIVRGYINNWGNITVMVYTTDNPEFYSDSDWGSMNETAIVPSTNMGWILRWGTGSTSEIIPIVGIGGPTRYVCDYCQSQIEQGFDQLYYFFVGGSGSDSYSSGLGYIQFNAYPDYNRTGYRTCCLA